MQFTPTTNFSGVHPQGHTHDSRRSQAHPIRDCLACHARLCPTFAEAEPCLHGGLLHPPDSALALWDRGQTRGPAEENVGSLPCCGTGGEAQRRCVSAIGRLLAQASPVQISSFALLRRDGPRARERFAFPGGGLGAFCCPLLRALGRQ